ncbi:MAG TPA: phosphate ABC transporter substrate-binding protein PstS [Humibacter sp.]|jgi:phosphate transport system substrate-binding protein|nr:phosphate ABC transporter substrate-binding protein PstS [Humibacter sp.]
MTDSEGNTVKFNKAAAAGTIALASVLALAACSSDGTGSASTSTSTASKPAAVDYSSLSGTLTAGGSSAQANAQAAWTAAFTAQASGVKINYDKSQGSGGGVTNWLNGSYDFAGTDAALSADQFTQAQTTCGSAGGVNIPVYLSGVSIIYKLDGVSKLNLDAKTIAEIFAGKITTWNDPAITALNSGVTLPSTAISVVHRSDGSGTTANFTTYLHQQEPSVWTWDAGTAWPNSIGSGQQGGSGVVNTVAAGNGTIGYADQSSIGDATAASIEVGSTGKFVAYSEAGATASLDASGVIDAQGDGDLTVAIDTTKITSTKAYPIPLLSYDVLCKSFKDAAQGKLTAAYLGFIVSSTGQKIGAKNAGAAPLPASFQTKAADTLSSIK